MHLDLESRCIFLRCSFLVQRRVFKAHESSEYRGFSKIVLEIVLISLQEVGCKASSNYKQRLAIKHSNKIYNQVNAIVTSLYHKVYFKLSL